MNPEPVKRESSKDMEYGEAFHTMLFEPEKFAGKYYIEKIEPMGIGKIGISQKNYYAIIDSIKLLRKSPNAQMFLSGGAAEVTIVFDYAGVRYRTRHDYFTPVVSPDFKTTYTLEVRKIQWSFEEYGYDVQQALYTLSRAEIKRQLMDGNAHIYGDAGMFDFKKFMASSSNEFLFIFQRKTPPHPYELLLPEDDTLEDGMARIQKATEIYLVNRHKYGTKPWPVCSGKIRPFSMRYGYRDSN